MAGIGRLAILYPKAIGDFFFVLPALHSVRRTLADTHITLLVKEKQAPLAVPQRGVLYDEVLVLGSAMRWREARRRLMDLRADVMIDLAGNDQTGLLMAWRGGRRLRPHWRDCKGICALYSPLAEAMPRLPLGWHRVDELLSFVACLGVAQPHYTFRLRLPDEAVAAGERIINEKNLRSGKVIVLNVGASRDTKRWPAEHFMALTRLLLAAGYRVALTGANHFRADGDYDRRLAERFAAEALCDGEACLDLIRADGLSPALQLQRDLYLLRYSGVPALVVGNDTGPMHMAGSVGEDAANPTLSLFGPTHWGRYAPYDPSRRFPDRAKGQWNRVLFTEQTCRPAPGAEACAYYRKGCAHKSCLSALLPPTVFEAIREEVGNP